MSKVDFIKKFKSIYTKPFFEEYGLKVSESEFNTDRVNVNIPISDINKDELINIVDKLFTKSDDTKTFINSMFDDSHDRIQNVFLGYSSGNHEVYFEMYNQGESSTCISFNDNDSSINNYKPLDDKLELEASKLTDIIKNKTGLIIVNPTQLFKGGFIKNQNSYYFLVLEQMSAVRDIFQTLCHKINPNERDTIIKWFNNNKDKIVSHVAYSNNNGKLILNIYTNESRTS